MNERVEAFLQKQADIKAECDYNYYYLVMQYARLLSDQQELIEISQKEYGRLYANHEAKTEYKNGKYYKVRQSPIDISEEEFLAVESAIPQDILNELKLQAYGMDLEKDMEGGSGAATFFTAIAWILWIGGFIFAFISAASDRSGAASTIFISTIFTYFIYGCFAKCAAELFKKLQTIVNLLKSKT